MLFHKKINIKINIFTNKINAHYFLFYLLFSVERMHTSYTQETFSCFLEHTLQRKLAFQMRSVFSEVKNYFVLLKDVTSVKLTRLDGQLTITDLLWRHCLHNGLRK